MSIRSHNFVKDEFYHIYIHSIEDLKIFPKKRDYERFLTLMFAANNKGKIPRLERHSGLNLAWDIVTGKVKLEEPLIDIVCFCLMPTHFHLLLRERKDGNISKYLHRILLSHSKYINIKYERRGHLFESKFNSKHVDTNGYLLTLSSYIHKNPKDLPDWKNKENKYQWSSYQDFINQNRWNNLLSKNIIIDQFKNNKEYKNFVEENYQNIDSNLNLT